MLQTHLAVSTVIIFGASFLPSPNFSPNEKVITTPSHIEKSNNQSVPPHSDSIPEHIRTGTPHPDTLQQSKTHNPEDQH